MDKHFETKTRLDKFGGITKDLRSSFTDNITKDSSGYCDICNTRYDNKKKHIESEQHNENIKKKRLVEEKWRDKVNELGLDHNMKHNQIIKSSSDYEDPRLLEAIEAMHNIHSRLKFNYFDVVRYTKPTDDKVEENEFSLMTRLYNGPYELDMLNGGLETRMQEQGMNQSEWSMQRFIKRTMYIHRFYPPGGCTTKVPFKSRYILNIHNTDNKCLPWCLIAYLHLAKDHPNIVSN